MGPYQQPFTKKRVRIELPPNENTITTMSSLKKAACVTSTFIESLVFTGPLLGWSSLAFCLKSEGYFDTCSQPVESVHVSASESSELETTSLFTNSSEHCSVENDTICADQTKTINDLYTYAAIICNIYCLASGYLLDKYGTWISRFLSCLLLTTGAMLMAISTPSSSYLYYFGFPMMSSGGIALLVSNIQIANLYPSKRGVIITEINGLFGSSSAVFLIVKMLYQSGIPLSRIMMSYGLLSLLCLVKTFLLMPRYNIPFDVPPGFDFGLCDLQSKKEVDERKVDLSKKSESFSNSASSMLYIGFLLFFGILLLRLNYFLSSYFAWLSDLVRRVIPDCDARAEYISKYVNILGTVQLLEAVTYAPLIGAFFDYLRRFIRRRNENLPEEISSLKANSVCLFICLIFGVISTILPCIDNIALQTVTIVSLCLYRCFYVGTIATFLTYAFPVEHFGKLYGIARVVGGFSTFLSKPIFAAVVENDNAFKDANIDFTIALILCFAQPINIYRCAMKKEKKFIDEDENNLETSFIQKELLFSELKKNHKVDHLNSSVMLNSLQSIAA